MFIGFLIFIFNFVSIDDKEMVKIVITGFIAWMGTIIGFYFGQKPVREMTRQVKTLTKETEKAKMERKDDTADLEDALGRYKKLEKNVDVLKNLVDDLTKGVK